MGTSALLSWMTGGKPCAGLSTRHGAKAALAPLWMLVLRVFFPFLTQRMAPFFFPCPDSSIDAIKSQSPRRGKDHAVPFILLRPTNSPVLWKEQRLQTPNQPRSQGYKVIDALDNSIPIKGQGFRLRLSKHHRPSPGKLRVKQGSICYQHKTPFPNGAECTCHSSCLYTMEYYAYWIMDSYFYFGKHFYFFLFNLSLNLI